MCQLSGQNLFASSAELLSPTEDTGRFLHPRDSCVPVTRALLKTVPAIPPMLIQADPMFHGCSIYKQRSSARTIFQTHLMPILYYFNCFDFPDLDCFILSSLTSGPNLQKLDSFTSLLLWSLSFQFILFLRSKFIEQLNAKSLNYT